MSTTTEQLRTLVFEEAFATVEVAEKGITFVLKEPSLQQREEYLKRLDYDNGQIRGSISQGLVYLIQHCTFRRDEGGGLERVFEDGPETYNKLLACPSQGLVDKLGKAAVSFMTPKAASAAGKDSAATETSK